MICREIQQSLGSQCAPGVSFRCTTQPGLALMADGVRWKQILINLVSNSLKFCREPGGTVHMSILKDESSGIITCSISDTGSIIPAEVIDRLFSKFEQAKDTSGGTGLGLVISQVGCGMHVLPGGSWHALYAHLCPNSLCFGSIWWS